MATRASPNVAPERQPPPEPESKALWHQPSSPAPRKLGDTSFRYRDLDPIQQEIRILRILPAADGAPIACEILHTFLNDPRGYIAISYAWGDAEDTSSIALDGYEFPVTVNLWQALERLRSTVVAVIVWADAVCINQRNVEERNLQVKAMAKVYSMAYEVAIWLGPEREDSNLAMVLLQKITGYSTNDTAITRIIKDPNSIPAFRALVELLERE